MLTPNGQGSFQKTETSQQSLKLLLRSFLLYTEVRGRVSNTSRRNIPEGFIITGFLVCPRLACDIRPRLFQRTMAPLSGKPDHPCLLLNRRIQSASGHGKSPGHHYGCYKGAWPLLLSLGQAQGSPHNPSLPPFAT